MRSVAAWQRGPLCILVALVATFARARAQAPDPVPLGSQFDSAGVPIHYTDEGKDTARHPEPVILIHGFGITANLQWRAPGVVGALAREYRVITLDCRGHGKSGKPRQPGAYGLQMAEDVVRLMDHLGIEKANLVGYSMGAFITLKVVTRHPDRVRAAVLGGAGWLREGDENWKLGDELAQSLEQGRGFWPLLLTIQPAGSGATKDNAALKGMNMLMTASNDVKALAAAVRGMNGLIVPESALAANQVPLLALVGERDPLREMTVAPMLGKTSNLRLRVLEGGDHMTTFVDPLFHETLTDFLADPGSIGLYESRPQASPSHEGREE